MAVVKIAVLSDIHAASVSKDHSRGTYITVPAAMGKNNPLDDLHYWIKNNPGLEVDYLVCPGDIANHADADAFQWMWEKIRLTANLLGAKEVHATCGNHDLDSRYLSDQNDDDPDAKGALLSMAERFPSLTEAEHNHFWAQNYVVINRETPAPNRVLLLNTCAYHGSKLEEIKWGRVSTRTINSIGKALAGEKRVGLNILVCHHHLLPLPSWDSSPDYQYVRKGGELIRVLEDSNVGPWLIVHGHRHWPECVYASGGAGSPVLFCAGSFGKADAQVTNQFHILEIEVDESASRPKGTIKTWTWSISNSWQPSEFGDKAKALTFRSGFGFEGSLSRLAEDISKHLHGVNTYKDWPELVSELPQLDNLLQKDFSKLRRELDQRHIKIHVENGEPIQVAMRRGEHAK
jgi:predicted phosphodiesterase